MECNFVVGQDVVCALKGPWFCENPSFDMPMDVEHPQFNKVYKIVNIRVFDPTGDVFLEFAEFLNAYNWRSFRPLQKRETDISWAHEILRSVTTKELV